MKTEHVAINNNSNKESKKEKHKENRSDDNVKELEVDDESFNSYVCRIAEGEVTNKKHLKEGMQNNRDLAAEIKTV